MKIKYIVTTTLLLCLNSAIISAQQPVEKKKGMEKAKATTQKMKEKTAKTAADMQEVANNTYSTVNNVKAILRVFEPFLVQMKGNTQAEPVPNNSAPVTTNDTPSIEDVNSNTSSSNTTQNLGVAGGTEANSATDITNSTAYNSDGTANWGCQDHEKYGCYLDAQKGIILDDVDVATQTGSVDIIFTSCSYAGKPLYALLTPQYAKSNTHARVFFSGAKYKYGNYPTKQWQEANASSVSEIRITGMQFEKIKDNNQLTAIVNQAGSFSDHLESRMPLTGRVFAVKTQLENRMSYALIYVVEQFGTTGGSSFLKVKVKVNGIDTNGDGLPD